MTHKIQLMKEGLRAQRGRVRVASDYKVFRKHKAHRAASSRAESSPDLASLADDSQNPTYEGGQEADEGGGRLRVLLLPSHSCQIRQAPQRRTRRFPREVGYKLNCLR